MRSVTLLSRSMAHWSREPPMSAWTAREWACACLWKSGSTRSTCRNARLFDSVSGVGAIAATQSAVAYTAASGDRAGGANARKLLAQVRDAGGDERQQQSTLGSEPLDQRRRRDARLFGDVGESQIRAEARTGAVRARRQGAESSRRARQLCRGRRPDDVSVGIVLADAPGKRG